MKKLCISLLISFLGLISITLSAQNEYPDSLLRRYAAKMLMVGFRGDSVTDNCDAARYVRDLHVGGIILFDVDLTGTKELGSRNITSKERLSAMTAKLQSLSDGKLIIALDQEGGRVARLKPQYGYTPTVSHEYLGKINSRDTTTHYAAIMARELAESGVNMNLAPDIDILNPDCPVIGKLHRAFSADTLTVTQNAEWFIDAHSAYGVTCAVKHFPGHGSSMADSHYGLTDVTNTWNISELSPFSTLINNGKLQAVMTAHIFNRNIDQNFPATLSHKTLTGLLREKLGFEGLILTDDMYMQGIIDNYSIEEAVTLAINAGADILVMGNNISTGFEPERPFRIVDIIIDAVHAGKISPARLKESYDRINRYINF